LCALVDGVVLRVDDLNIHARFASGLFRGFRLFDLVIVIVGCKRNKDSQFFHSRLDVDGPIPP
jgi:hypothetical protein